MGSLILALLISLTACGSSGGTAFDTGSGRPPADAPTISSVTSNTGPTSGGTAVTVTGTNFQSGVGVTFGGATATSVNVASNTEITAITPKGNAGPVNVIVTNSDAQTGILANGFTYENSTTTPTITQISPAVGLTTGGTTVTINGANFASGATVTFGAEAATPVTLSNSDKLVVTTPAEAAGAVDVVVKNPGGQSVALASSFTFVTPGSLAVDVAGATSTQAVLSYTAPDTNPCTVGVSPSPTSLAPPVYAVDPSLFPGSNSDGGHAAGPRIFVVGKRTIAQATDGNNYSLALENDTQYSFQVTCGSQQFQGSFTTTNIPLGKTFGEPAIVDSNGNQIFPTVPDVRGYRVIDPMTGTLMRLVSLRADTHGYTGWYDAGTAHACANQLVNGGYHCIVPGRAGIASMYWISPTDGSARFLGMLKAPAGPDYAASYPGGSDSANFDSSDPNVYYSLAASNTTPHKTVILMGTYAGNDIEARPNSYASFTWTNLTPVAGNRTLTDMISAFDPSYKATEYSRCGLYAVQSSDLVIKCARYDQNSPGWVVVVDLGSKTPGGTRVVAAGPTYAAHQTRWCGLHYINYIGDIPYSLLSVHTMQNAQDTGPWEVQLTSAVGATTTSFSIGCIAADPACNNQPATPNTPPDGVNFLQDAAVGDVFQFSADGTRECVRITGISGETWTVQRGVNCGVDGGTVAAQTHASGALLHAECDVALPDIWWEWLSDPHMRNVIPETTFGGGHRVDRDYPNAPTGYGVNPGYEIRTGSFPQQFGQPPSYTVTDSPPFDGIDPFASGNSYQKHISYGQAEAPPDELTWALDVLPFVGGMYSGPGTTGDHAVSVSGDLYQYILATGDVSQAHQFSTALPYFAISGDRLLKDVSGPGSVIDGTSADNYEFCIAQQTNECVSGSSAGDIYFNVPSLQELSPVCTSGTRPVGICIENTAAYGEAMIQLGLLPANKIKVAGRTVYGAGNSRVLLSPTMLGLYRWVGAYSNAHSLPDGSWALMPALFEDKTINSSKSIFAVKIPPYPASDGIDRSTYIPVSVTVPAVTGATTAKVFYGYEENGPRTAFHCTQRPEACSISAAPGSAVTLPGIPQRVVFYQITYYDSSGKLISTSPLGAKADP